MAKRNPDRRDVKSQDEKNVLGRSKVQRRLVGSLLFARKLQWTPFVQPPENDEFGHGVYGN
jgi:hypothetical protein